MPHLKSRGTFEQFQDNFNRQQQYTGKQKENHHEEINNFRKKEDICKLQPFRCARSSAHELDRSVPLWYAVCTLLFFCSLCLTRTGHPEIPQMSTAALGAGFHPGQAAGRERAASLPSLVYMRA